jgi:hypothetical protein
MTAWSECSAADFTAPRAAVRPPGCRSRPGWAVFIPMPALPAQSAPAREELPGQDSMFGPDDTTEEEL